MAVCALFIALSKQNLLHCEHICNTDSLRLVHFYFYAYMRKDFAIPESHCDQSSLPAVASILLSCICGE